jgi:hypothetical protein
MPQTVSQVLALARGALNDDDAVLWPDYRLISKLKAAQGQLISALVLTDNQITYEQTAVMTVPANSTDGQQVDITGLVGYPTNLRIPMFMRERRVGQDEVDFVDMHEKAFIPNVQKTEDLRYWAWRENIIYVTGATIDKEIFLRYRGSLTTASAVTDSVVVDGAEEFLAYQTAFLALTSIPGMSDARASIYKDLASANLTLLLKAHAKSRQSQPVRRRGYRYGKRAPTVF